MTTPSTDSADVSAPRQRPGVAPRITAINIIAHWLKTRAFPERMLPNDSHERGFVSSIVYGVVRNRRALEWALFNIIGRSPSEAARPTLLVGAFQILYMPDIQDYASVFATVEASKTTCPRATAFVNGVMRNMIRNRDELKGALAKQPLPVRLSHPNFIVERWSTCFGREIAAELCRIDNLPADTAIVFLPQFADRVEAFVEECNAAEIKVERHASEPRAVILPHGFRPESLPHFDENLFTIQDPSTLIAVKLLDLHPETPITFLDACASPGGKLVQAAALISADSRIIANDIHEDRLPRLRENINRFNLASRVTETISDAAVNTWDGMLFDRILLDAPCSNTGVLRRRSDARWRVNMMRQETLVKNQRALLENLAQRLAPGGRIVYSLCSIEPDEGADNVEAFLNSHPEFDLAEQKLQLPELHNDGAYAAAIVRK